MVPCCAAAGGMLSTNMITLSTFPANSLGPRRPLTVDESRWLACSAHMAGAAKQTVQPLSGTATGRVRHGQGAGGDGTLEIDRACETAMRRVLEREAPAPHLLVSEEVGFVGAPSAPWRVVVDPLDGSLNAKRGLDPFCASIAVADGVELKDVCIGYVEDYTRDRCFAAVRGAGLLKAGAQDAPCFDPDRFVDDLVEVVLLEAGRPNRHHFRYRDLSVMSAVKESQDLRIRQIGSLALSLCYVAVGVADMLVAAVRSRSVDIAAGLLILAEAGGGAVALGGEDLWSQPLDLNKRCAFAAWRAGLDGGEIISRSGELARALSLDA